MTARKWSVAFADQAGMLRIKTAALRSAINLARFAPAELSEGAAAEGYFEALGSLAEALGREVDEMTGLVERRFARGQQ